MEMKNFIFHPDTIGECFFDIFCQPNCINIEDLLKIIASILNGELTSEDFKKRILEWIDERGDEFYLDEDGQIRIKNFRSQR
tara:strand:+ start:149 stop:394 length:246 start_codon:yes stop_codon:yes gene_type:complete